MQGELIEGPLTRSVIGAFFEVYRELGFGFLEHIYVTALEDELVARGHRVGVQVPVPVHYKKRIIGNQRIDVIVDERLIVEVKSTLELHIAWERQLISYLKATTLEVGLLLHFGPKPKFKRKVFRNDLKPFSR